MADQPARLGLRLAAQVVNFFGELEVSDRLHFLQLLDLVRVVAQARRGRPGIECHAHGMWVQYVMDGDMIDIVQTGRDPYYPRIL